MTSKKLGRSTSKVEVTNISVHGIWVLLKEREYYLPYEDFPWFKDARISEVHNVKLLNGHHLLWPDLDVDLEWESLHNLEQYPLIYK